MNARAGSYMTNLFWFFATPSRGSCFSIYSTMSAIAIILIPNAQIFDAA
jgi:hypothetical protein